MNLTKTQPDPKKDLDAAVAHVLTIIIRGAACPVGPDLYPEPDPAGDDPAHYGAPEPRESYED